ncbi:MAG: helix-turn-helix domain-containing protein [Spirochaetales bacterium]
MSDEEMDSTDRVRQLAPLANFLTDYEYLKQRSGLTQKQIAERASTSQSAISRLENMRGLPAYDLLVRISEAVGGELVVSPMGEFTFTLPYDIQESAKNTARVQGLGLVEWMNQEIRKGLRTGNKVQFREALENDTRVRRVSGGSSLQLAGGAGLQLGHVVLKFKL